MARPTKYNKKVNKIAENYEPILNEIKNLDKAKSLFSDKLTRVIIK